MPPSRRPAWVLIAAALSGASSGCLLDAGAYESAGAGAASATSHSGGSTSQGGNGNGGAGAGTATAGAGAGTSAGGATGGAGGSATTTTTMPQECTQDTMCPDPAGFCADPKCDKGVCTTKAANENMVCGVAMGQCYDVAKCKGGECISEPLQNGTPLASFPNDCKKRVCDGDGNAVTLPDDGDHADSDDCMDRSCSDGDLVETPVNGGNHCFLNAGWCCGGICCVGAAGCCSNAADICDYGFCL